MSEETEQISAGKIAFINTDKRVFSGRFGKKFDEKF